MDAVLPGRQPFVILIEPLRIVAPAVLQLCFAFFKGPAVFCELPFGVGNLRPGIVELPLSVRQFGFRLGLFVLVRGPGIVELPLRLLFDLAQTDGGALDAERFQSVHDRADRILIPVGKGGLGIRPIYQNIQIGVHIEGKGVVPGIKNQGDRTVPDRARFPFDGKVRRALDLAHDGEGRQGQGIR